MVDSISNDQGAVALDINQLQNWLRGDTIVSGCAPSAGGSSLEVDVASGTARVGGSNVAVSSQTATLSSGGSNPRKDLVYIDTGGNVQNTSGTAAAARPSGSTRFDTYQPAPPDSTGVTGAVVATVWVAAGKSGTFASADIRDRRILASVDLDSVTTERVDVTDNRVYVWGDNGNFLGSIDPSTTTTGLQDALDLIKTVSSTAGGKVFVPAQTTVEQSQTVPSDHLRSVQLIGASLQDSIVDFTGSGAGFTLSPSGGVANSYIHNVKFTDNRSTKNGPLFHFTGIAGKFNVGSIAATWDDPCVHFDTGHFFESWWGYASFGGDGQKWLMENQNGPANYIGCLVLRNDNATGMTFEYNQGGGDLNIGTLYHGSPVPEAAIYSLINNNGLLRIGSLHLEDNTGGTITSPIDFEGGFQQVGCVLLNSSGATTFSRGVTLSFSQGGAHIGRIFALNSATVTEKLRVANDADETVVYEGPASDVNNQSGSALSNPVVCLLDGVYKTSTGTGFTRGTDRRIETPSSQAYSPSNVTTDRTYDANSTTDAELADVLGTLISDLQTGGYIQ